jgi:hypothetical protein
LERGPDCLFSVQRKVVLVLIAVIPTTTHRNNTAVLLDGDKIYLFDLSLFLQKQPSALQYSGFGHGRGRANLKLGVVKPYANVHSTSVSGIHIESELHLRHPPATAIPVTIQNEIECLYYQNGCPSTMHAAAGIRHLACTGANGIRRVVLFNDAFIRYWPRRYSTYAQYYWSMAQWWWFRSISISRRDMQRLKGCFINRSIRPLVTPCPDLLLVDAILHDEG